MSRASRGSLSVPARRGPDLVERAIPYGVDRRTFLRAFAATALATLFPLPLPAANENLKLGPARPFDWDDLVERARARATEDFTPRESPNPEIAEKIDYDAHGAIRFLRRHALFRDGPGAYPVTFFPLGRYFPKPVQMHVVTAGKARRIRYSPGYFEMPSDSVARELPDDAGFAGFRIHESRRRDDWKTQDWAAFLGASYFRAIGALGQYGLSARGVAIDTAVDSAEEFPDFVEFYIEPSPREGEPVTVFALLDGPSVTGAYRFRIRRAAGVVMDVAATLFFRRSVKRLGIAPLTSMFWYDESSRPRFADWRPEIHDSDGLALWSGGGERLWRPLNNPERASVSAFLDENPRGFGLVQRDRNFEHYLDGVHYERRPSLWVEPLGRWGSGAVELVELPTDDEIHDNVVAFWVPETSPEPGARFHFDYRLHWVGEEPFFPEELARTFATRIGRGGEAGKTRPEGVRKFVVEFVGGPLEGLNREVAPEAGVDASRGRISNVRVEPVPTTHRWRARFDLAAKGTDPVELRLYLRIGDRPLTETWVYRHHPDRTG